MTLNIRATGNPNPKPDKSATFYGSESESAIWIVDSDCYFFYNNRLLLSYYFVIC